MLNNLTIAGNTAPTGAGIYFGNSNTTVLNSIIADNTGGNCSFAASYSIGSNDLQFGDSSCPGVVVGNPLLGSLANSGGPTRTMALLVGSPAIDAGNPALPGSGGNACLATDQRGAHRPIGARCDIGAYEAGYLFLPLIFR